MISKQFSIQQVMPTLKLPVVKIPPIVVKRQTPPRLYFVLALILAKLAAPTNYALAGSTAKDSIKTTVPTNLKPATRSDSSAEDISSLIDQLDAADKANFNDLVYKMRSCTIQRDFACSEQYFKDAKRYAHGNKDSATLASVYGEFKEEQRLAEAEKAKAIADQKRREAAEKKREELLARRDAEEQSAMAQQASSDAHNEIMQSIQSAGQNVNQYIRSSGAEVLKAQRQAQRINQQRQQDADYRAFERIQERELQPLVQQEPQRQTRLAALAITASAAGTTPVSTTSISNEAALAKKQQRDDALRQQQEEDKKLAALQVTASIGVMTPQTTIQPERETLRNHGLADGNDRICPPDSSLNLGNNNEKINQRCRPRAPNVQTINNKQPGNSGGKIANSDSNVAGDSSQRVAGEGTGSPSGSSKTPTGSNSSEKQPTLTNSGDGKQVRVSAQGIWKQCEYSKESALMWARISSENDAHDECYALGKSFRGWEFKGYEQAIACPNGKSWRAEITKAIALCH
jgi:hypothetical protein